MGRCPSAVPAYQGGSRQSYIHQVTTERALGMMFGGDGRVNFALPDLRGRMT